MTTTETYEATTLRLPADVLASPTDHRVLTGDRPTGRLHVGHYFGSLQNRVRLQNQGVDVFVLVADYQVITDRDITAGIDEVVTDVVLDYLATGLDPDRSTVFAHSAVPALNQLMLPFLSLVSTGELSRNPTVKEEIQAGGRETVSGLMLTYPVHQAADILFCHADLVPVGDDQLPHLELTRDIARRFNDRYAPIFTAPEALLSHAPRLKGLDGRGKMGKSRGNSIPLSATADETTALIRSAVTDSQRRITYDPPNRPEVSNLVLLAALCRGEAPEAVAESIGDGGASALKRLTTEAVNDFFAPMRRRRREFETDRGIVTRILERGNARANEIADATLAEVRIAMGTRY
ncbi:tryptophanyl-tRNA synthetase [Stackebrandtia albiflava]|uniref:Tryptophan--tRNA ligase n=1 Tax=Stackebrandtia albiflava TaxID=406432 RepID=A0A562VBI3_9ACTN|nr:tryptophan--tRNA ligase [Stackebrandtia albiflava]TWJ15245.1 tryptophanyl-tRNA synthetase [Stackebrandtia albiflava]